MSNEPLYLKPNIQVEPLINQWYAWIQILPPANAAMNIIERHLHMMRSYIKSPALHAAAVKNPAMRGGPFIDLDGKRLKEVRELLLQTENLCQDLSEFVRAVKALNELLEKEASGDSMEPLYRKVPDALRGYVELCYDLNNNPSFRFFEGLLYKSKLYKKGFQTIALSEIVSDTSRPFIFTTPRLKDDRTIHVQVPFDSLVLDELFKMKRSPKPVSDMAKALNIPQEQHGLFESFFTTEIPKAYEKYTGEYARIRYFGHACILIETEDVTMLLDPVLSYTYESDISRYGYEDLPDQIDYVLITHSHHDHVLLETMLQLRHKIKSIIVGRNMEGTLQDPSLKLALENVGFKNIIEIRDFQEIRFKDGYIVGIPFIGEHHDLLINSKSCYYINIKGKSILSMADSCNIEPALYERVHEIIGDIDVLFLGMECDGAPASWVYGPLFFPALSRSNDQTRRGRGSNFKEAANLVDTFKCKEIYVYAMGAEPWVRYILDVEYTDESNPIIESKKLIRECLAKGILADNLFGEKEIFIENELQHK